MVERLQDWPQDGFLIEKFPELWLVEILAANHIGQNHQSVKIALKIIF